ncbi:DEAD/DEAH box helicase [Actinobacillus pleuropneumoniae]|uniref:ATP-dependent RNA helicase DeaD n=4 Tax=Actinobacillus pleuropneumoniae TaxID=715 RepID=A3MZU1_ACTP2|nr:DEAD/DEAH box helicase [Actinobacillus pleuropneumoniae]ABN73677.1 cold-shock DEAD box protein A-like protein [Actinobacillus pleuropneumoniae serovar 5b str. L20]ACE61271.1 cold-shock DEAD box protein A-like protein [Actinobacillus pleuropneumoniae serovar 7 str. AP76]EFL79177.1 cold-shock DEAD box protein-A [Actinobacillus pleuropneumoniae serovar 2 str. 4226]KIE92372.1 putative cold-shock DEAD box protein A-like protein [Actinobacillus pleuropneumoniae]KIE92475.1 putative cold-shock DEAD
MTTNSLTFADLGLPQSILDAVNDMGFVTPSPIQQETIPHLLAGRDVLGMAQTGSGKTAAFSLPLLAQIDPTKRHPQMLVMAPTRELAIQVADACEQFTKNMKGVNVVTVYGGQRYDIQLRALKQGSQVVVGTPGRILDHIRRGTLDLSALQSIVLDEADEMLRMGFIDDVETVMAELPENHQTALFSATMPEPIRRITRRFMQDPQEVKIQATQRSAPDITQSYWLVNGFRKNDALLRFLEVEEFDAAIIFTRTKTGTIDITELCERNGYRTAALNGDMTQQAREQTLDKLKSGRLDILVATDVAARGIDIERISLVVNFDIPLDAESYVHRIGRTGRAGRSGRALLFVEPRERRLLRNIEHLMKKPIDEVAIPNHEILMAKRREKFKARVSKQLEHHDLEKYRELLEDLFTADQDHEELAAAMMMMLQEKQKLILPPDPEIRAARGERGRRDRDDRRGGRDERRGGREHRENNGVAMDLYRIELGREDGVEVRHIVGAIANEGDISSRYIGHIKLHDTYSTIELPQGMPNHIVQHFAQKARVLNKQMQMSLLGPAGGVNSQPFEERRGGGRRNDRNDRNDRRSDRGGRSDRREGGFNDRKKGGFKEKRFNDKGRGRRD